MQVMKRFTFVLDGMDSLVLFKILRTFKGLLASLSDNVGATDTTVDFEYLQGTDVLLSQRHLLAHASVLSKKTYV